MTVGGALVWGPSHPRHWNPVAAAGLVPQVTFSIPPPFPLPHPGLAPTCSPMPSSIDIPSGWDVHTGDAELGSRALAPDTLISLTAPKQCAAYFKGRHHWLGGRFVPPRISAEFGLRGLPPYPGSDQVWCIRVCAWGGGM
jgi:hypothetical protein